MTRKKKLLLSMGTATLKQAITIVCGFVLPRYILRGYGSQVNGLVTSITQFLGFIAFLEMGVGPVIQSNLYEPLAKKNYDEISKIVVSSEKFFRRIAYIFTGYIVVLIAFFSQISNAGFPFLYTASLIAIIAISTFAQYYFGITYQLLLNADQKSYIQLILQCVTILLNTIVSVFLIMKGFSIQIVKLSTAIVYFLRPIGQAIYIHKHYNINKRIEYEGEPIKQKWNGFAQHITAVIVKNTDVTVLTLLDDLKSVSVYSVYYNVVYGIENTVMTLATGLEAMWGNMLANHEDERLTESFAFTEWVMHNGVSFLFTVTGILIVPFIQVYTQGVSDANYRLPVFGTLLVAAYGAECLRVPYFRMIKAAGHYKQTQVASVVEMLINVLLSVALVKRFGLNGVAVGTLAAMLYHTIYFALYLEKNILYRPFRSFCKHLLLDIIYIITCFVCTSSLELGDASYISWIILAVKVTIISFFILLVYNLLFHRKMLGAFVCKKYSDKG